MFNPTKQKTCTLVIRGPLKGPGAGLTGPSQCRTTSTIVPVFSQSACLAAGLTTKLLNATFRTVDVIIDTHSRIFSLFGLTFT